MLNNQFVLKGSIAYTPEFNSFKLHDTSFLVCKDGKVVGVFDTLPELYSKYPIYDYSGQVIIPGMSDLHMHAPQYAFRGIGQNMENSQWGTWFEKYAFPEESNYSDLVYARKAYSKLISDLLKTPTTRVSMFATIHRPATELLMQLLANAGFAGFVGKVNMDRNSTNGLIETTEESLDETELWLNNTLNKYQNMKPIITPRYIPTCTDDLLQGLGKLSIQYNVPIQSHLLEGLDEIEWVKEIKPNISCYAQGYDMYSLLGSCMPTLMAHCVYPSQADFQLMTQRKIWVAHCPGGNMHSTGGIAPILKYLRAGVRVGLASDTAGGNTINMFRILLEAVMASKTYWAFKIQCNDPWAKKDYLTIANAFYLATKGGGSFFGKVGSFEPGYCFDAVVIDDVRLVDFKPRSLYERVERIINLADDRDIVAKFVNGKKIL
ncbi:MAG: amidohydrolase family protein [Christensenellales bacterium]|jgi:guanine deaminase